MESKVKLFGHAIHPMLIVFPLGLLGASVVFDLLWFATGNSDFPIAAYWCIGLGVISGLLAAVFGFWDWLNIPAGTRAKSIGLLHGGGNVVVVLLFALSWLLRRGAAGHLPSNLAFILALAGLLLALVTGWLGGELVERLRVGVDDAAGLNAPNSLTSSARQAGGPHAAMR